MDQTSLRHLLDVFEVPLRAVLPKCLSVLDEDQETEDLQNACRSCNYEAVLIPFEKNGY